MNSEVTKKAVKSRKLITNRAKTFALFLQKYQTAVIIKCMSLIMLMVCILLIPVFYNDVDLLSILTFSIIISILGLIVPLEWFH